MSESERPVAGEIGQAQPVQAATQSPAVPVNGGESKPRRRVRSDEEVAYWRTAVDEWNALLDEARRAGGLLPSIRGFCRDRRLRETSFYWWRRELAIRDGKPLPTMRAVDSTRVAGHRPARPGPAGAFVQLKVRPTAPVSTSTLCEIVVGRLILRVAPGFDAGELSRLLDVLHAR
jgi:hypothetical protein